MLSALPEVKLEEVPAPVSGVRVARVVVSATWRSSQAPPGSASSVFFRFLLLGDPRLGAYHEPPLCSAADAALTALVVTPEDCVEAGCTGVRCVYRLALPLVPKTTTSITLQVCGRVG